MTILFEKYYEENKERPLLKIVEEIELLSNPNDSKFQTKLEALKKIRQDKEDKLIKTLESSNGEYATTTKAKEKCDELLEKTREYSEKIAKGEDPQTNLYKLCSEHENELYEEGIARKLYRERKQAESDASKKELDEFLIKIADYNEKVANGEDPGVKLGDLVKEYKDNFTEK